MTLRTPPHARRVTGGPIFDAHLHVIDPRFPLVPNDGRIASPRANEPERDGYVPDPFTVRDYLDVTRPLGVRAGAVVSGSFQGTDQTYLRAALDALGPGFVGVTQLAPGTDDETIAGLHADGVRAVRCNLRRGAGAGLDDLELLARRAHDVAGWHTELYVDGEDLADLEALLATLPQVVVDHLGLAAAGLPALLRLVERGAKVKASGFGRVDFDVAAALRDIARANPGALLFGTDLPSTRAPRPFHPADIDLLVSALGERDARRALWDNAVVLYDPPGIES